MRSQVDAALARASRADSWSNDSFFFIRKPVFPLPLHSLLCYTCRRNDALRFYCFRTKEVYVGCQQITLSWKRSSGPLPMSYAPIPSSKLLNIPFLFWDLFFCVSPIRNLPQCISN